MVNRMIGKTRTSRKKSNFVYRRRSADEVKKRAEDRGRRFDSPFADNVDIWRIKDGENTVRILPPTWDDHKSWGYDVMMHMRVGPDASSYACLKMKGERCPICDAAQEAKDAGEDDEYKALRPQNRVVAWVIDRDGETEMPLLWPMSFMQSREIEDLSYSKKTGKVLYIDSPEEGFDVSLRRTGQGLKTRYSGLQFDRDPSEISDDPKTQEKIIDYITENPLPSVLKFYPEDYLVKIMSGTAPEPDEDAEEEDEDSPRSSKKGGKGKASRRDEEEDEDAEEQVEEDDNEEEDEKPRGKKRGRRDADEEEDEDAEAEDDSEEESEENNAEDEDDDQPAKKKGKRGKRDAEEEDDDSEEDAEEDDVAEDDDAEEEGEEEPDEEEEEKPRSKKRGKHDDDDEEDEDGEEDEDPPARKASGKKPHRDEDDDEDNEDDEEEDDRPTRKPVRAGKPKPKAFTGKAGKPGKRGR